MTWQPIETAPKTRPYVMITDGASPPEIVTWRPFAPEREDASINHVFAAPEGWYRPDGVRSRTKDAAWWADVPDLPGAMMDALLLALDEARPGWREPDSYLTDPRTA